MRLPTADDLEHISDTIAFVAGVRCALLGIDAKLARYSAKHVARLHDLLDDAGATHELVHEAQVRRGFLHAVDVVARTITTIDGLEPEALLRRTIDDLRGIEADNQTDGRCNE